MAMRSGSVSAADLACGLFAFNLSRSQVFNPAEADEVGGKTLRQHENQRLQLLTALEKAEADGRVRWGNMVGRRAYDVVDELLTANGHEPLAKPPRATSMDNLYSMRTVAQRTELAVIWN